MKTETCACKAAENCAVQAHKRCAAISHTSPARGSPAPHAVASIVRMAGHDFCAVEFICSRGGRADYRAHLADSLAHLAHPRSHLADFRVHLVVSRAHLCLVRLRRQWLCTCRVWSPFVCVLGGTSPGSALAELYVIPCECGWHAVLLLPRVARATRYNAPPRGYPPTSRIGRVRGVCARLTP